MKTKKEKDIEVARRTGIFNRHVADCEICNVQAEGEEPKIIPFSLCMSGNIMLANCLRALKEKI